jgi:hypothetical protein
VAKTEVVARLEGQLGHLVAEFNRIEEEELQSQEMVRGQYMIDEDCPSNPHHKHVQTTTTLVSEERVDDHEEEEEEMEEQIEPPPNPSNDKEVSTKAHSFVTIPLETYRAPHASLFQCLKEPSYVEIFLKNFYIRWRNILLDGYLILKKKEWKGLVGHPYEWGRCGNFLFYFPHCIFYLFSFCYFIFCHFIFMLFQFLTAINFLMFVLVRKRLLLVFDRCFDV